MELKVMGVREGGMAEETSLLVLLQLLGSYRNRDRLGVF